MDAQQIVKTHFKRKCPSVVGALLYSKILSFICQWRDLTWVINQAKCLIQRKILFRMSQIIPVKISFSNIFVVCSWTVVIGKLKTHFLFLTKYPLWENSKEKPSSSHSQNTYCYFDYLLPSLVSSAISLPTHPQPFRPLQSSSFVFFKS